MSRICTLVLLLGALSPSAATSEEPRATKGKKYALLVGVTEYKHSSFSTLKYTENDVEKLADVLRDKSAAFTNVRVLSTKRGAKDKKDAPTAANVAQALADLVADKDRDDVVLIGLAGHGVRLEIDNPDGKGKSKSYSFFCPSDADLVGVEYATGKSKTLVNLDDLLEQLGKCGAGTKLALIDACRNDVKAAVARNIDPEMTTPRGVGLLLSCGPGQRAWETDKLGGGHGVFFHFVLEGMKSKARNLQGEVTWLRLVEYVQREVTRQVPTLLGKGAKQTPHNLTNMIGESPVLLAAPRAATAKLSAEAEAIRKGMAQIETVARTAKTRSASAETFAKALAHLEGRNERHDPAEAAKLFREAADAGHDLSRAALAHALARGVGAKRDDAEAKRLGKLCFAPVKAAAERDDADAQAQLGRLHAAGLGTRKDAKAAFDWHLKAARGNSSLGMLDLAAALSLRGAAGEKEGFGWYLSASKKNNADALFVVGQHYADGKPWLEKDRAAARKYLKQAAESEHREARELLRKMEK